MNDSFQISQDKYPMIGKITQRSDDSITCERTLSLDTDRFLDHHRFNNTPFLLGVFGLELFAELGKILYPTKTIKQFEDVHFKSAIKLKEDKPCTINAKVISNGEHADAEITTNIVDTSETKLHFKAKVVFGDLKQETQKIPQLKKMPLLTQDFIYQILPHGSTFHVIEELNTIENEMIAIGRTSKDQLFDWKVKELLIEPYFIEAGFQAIGLMDFILSGRTGLPSKIQKLVIYESDDKPHFIVGGENPEKNGFFNFAVLSKKGNVLLKVIGFQMVEINLGETTSILDKLRSHRIRQLIPIPKKSWLEVIDKQLFSDKLSREPDFVATYLRKDELEELESLSGSDKQDRLLELFALKRAPRMVLLSRKMLNFKITRDEAGDYFCSHKGKQIYLTIVDESNYLLVLASRNRKDGLDFYANREDIKTKIGSI
ncbi:MAG: hypothetical protein ACTSO7_11055 [Candidatus Heimdallarchaeota archaeon]